MISHATIQRGRVEYWIFPRLIEEFCGNSLRVEDDHRLATSIQIDVFAWSGPRKK